VDDELGLVVRMEIGGICRLSLDYPECRPPRRLLHRNSDTGDCRGVCNCGHPNLDAFCFGKEQGRNR
jgi:hypothetical protein